MALQVPKFLTPLADNTFRFMAALNFVTAGRWLCPADHGRISSAGARHGRSWHSRCLRRRLRARCSDQGCRSSLELRCRPECSTAKNRVVHSSGKSFSYGELAAEAAAYSPSHTPQLKDKSKYTFVGQPIKRFDIPSKVNGTAHPWHRYRSARHALRRDQDFASLRLAKLEDGRGRRRHEASRREAGGESWTTRWLVIADRFWRGARDAALRRSTPCSRSHRTIA